MTVSEYEMYMTALDEVEKRIGDDAKFPVVKDSKIETCCYATLKFPEEDVLSDEKPKTITLTKEQRLTRKYIVIECRLWYGNIQLRKKLKATLRASHVLAIHAHSRSVETKKLSMYHEITKEKKTKLRRP